MTTLSVGQLFSNDEPKTIVQSLATNTFVAVWTPASGKKVRVRRIEISGAFTADDLIEIAQDTTVKLNYRWQEGVIPIDMPGEGWLTTTVDEAVQIRHQNGAGVNITVNIWGRDE